MRAGSIGRRVAKSALQSLAMRQVTRPCFALRLLGRYPGFDRATDERLARQGELVRRFMRATVKGQSVYLTNRNEGIMRDHGVYPAKGS